ncbi:AMP-binding protein [Cereibacter sp. SYSU M97828]|nr:AMP-binding protein [Cereibacter flavus]
MTDTILSILRAGAAAHPEATALRFVDPAELDFEGSAPRIVTYGQLLPRVVALANAYRALSGKDRPTVSLLIPSTIDGIVALLAAEVAGRANPINHFLAPDEIAAAMAAAGADIAVGHGAPGPQGVWARLETAAAGIPVRIATDRASAPAGAHTVRDLVQAHPTALAGPEPQAGDLAALFNTAGTTGRPKIVPLTHRNLLAAASALSSAWAMDGGTRIVNALPLFHVAGSNLLLTAPLLAGAEVQLFAEAGLRSPLVLARHWDLVQHARPTVIGGIPSSLVALLEIPLKGADISSVRFCATGGAPMPAIAAAQFERMFGLPIHTIYGMTETAGLIATAPVAAPPDYATVGRPAPQTDVRILEYGEGGPGAPVASGPGVIAVRGPQVFGGYLEGGGLADGWLVTGDMGAMTGGALAVTGRSKDIIIRSGNNIDPSVIEEAAESHPAVAACAAVAMPDRYAGEVPALFVTLHEGMSPGTDAIEHHLRQRLAEPHARPAHIFVVRDLPLTRVGKVFRLELRRMAAEHALRAALPDFGGAITLGGDGAVLVAGIDCPQSRRTIEGLGLRLA